MLFNVNYRMRLPVKTLVPEVFLDFSVLLIFLRMRELRSGENTNREAERKRKLWLLWTFMQTPGSRDLSLGLGLADISLGLLLAELVN